MAGGSGGGGVAAQCWPGRWTVASRTLLTLLWSGGHQVSAVAVPRSTPARRAPEVRCPGPPPAAPSAYRYSSALSFRLSPTLTACTRRRRRGGAAARAGREGQAAVGSSSARAAHAARRCHAAAGKARAPSRPAAA
jgi:hypothetical protein